MPQRNLLILTVAAAVSVACYVAGEQNPYARYVARSLSTIDREALHRVPDTDLYDGAMNAMVDVLRKHGDEHSQFLGRDEADPFRAEIRQQFGGIGVRIRMVGDPPELVIVGAPEPGTPAARADVRSGDHVLEIDGQSTVGMSLIDVLRAMRGEPGEPVRLLVRHADEDQPEMKELIRKVIQVDSILGDRRTAEGGWEFRLEEDPRIAHIRVTTFGNKTTAELGRTLERLSNEGVTAAVLDLRDDAGGALDTAIAICDMLLPDELTIVETRGRDGVVYDRYETTGNGQFRGLPLVVLVNQNSASASEIVAACLQDHGRAAVAGQRTYGKGTVQKLIPVESGRSLLKLTAASYWRPSGKNIHRAPSAKDSDDWGVTPDAGLDVPLSKEEHEAYLEYRAARDLWGDVPAGAFTERVESNEEDPPADPFEDRQLQRAVEHLQQLLDTSDAA
jgi:carboxyl-terminal processing protease